jgi:hypothetical protein
LPSHKIRFRFSPSVNRSWLLPVNGEFERIVMNFLIVASGYNKGGVLSSRKARLCPERKKGLSHKEICACSPRTVSRVDKCNIIDISM